MSAKKPESGSEVFFKVKESVCVCVCVCVCKWVNCQAQRPLGTCISLLLFVSALYDTTRTQIHSTLPTFL